MRTTHRALLLPLVALATTSLAVLMLIARIVGHSIPLLIVPFILFGSNLWRPLLTGIRRRFATQRSATLTLTLALVGLLLAALAVIVLVSLYAPDTATLVVASLVAPGLILTGFYSLPGGASTPEAYTSSGSADATAGNADGEGSPDSGGSDD